MKRKALLDRYKRNKERQSGEKQERRKRKFKPELGTKYRVRVLPWNPNDPQDEWDPFKDISFYYNIARWGIPAPSQYGKKDPVQETIDQLLEDGMAKNDPEVKRLYPRKRTFTPVLVEGQEEKGVQYWEYGVTVESQLLEILNDEEEYGDPMDFKEGRWMKVMTKKPEGKQYPETTVQCGGRPTPLTKSKSKLNEWLENLPDLDEEYPVMSYDELEGHLNKMLGEDEEEEKGDDDEDDDDSEKISTKSSKSKKAAKKTASTVVEDDDDDDDDFDDVDEAFADLDDDDE